MKDQGWSLCNSCGTCIPDARTKRLGKRCAVAGCFDDSFNCGCTIQDCSICFAPVCLAHLSSHTAQCSSTFTQRCGWRQGLSSLRFQETFCGSLLTNESKRQCLSCGVQCCADCGVSCAGYQPQVHYLSVLGPPPKMCKFAHQACSAFSCFRCQVISEEGRCPRCNSKRWRNQETTGYSEPSDLDSDFSEADSNSDSCDELEGFVDENIPAPPVEDMVV